MIATRERRDSLLRTLERLRELSPRPPVVVVDNGSRDGSAADVARRAPWARVVALPRNAGAAARTIGARLVEEPYVAFCDDDSWWAQGGLERAAAALDARPRLALVAARVLVGREEREDPLCGLMERTPLPRRRGAPGPPVLGFLACGAVVRRDAFLGVGGFEPRLGVGGEEQLLAIDLARAGWELCYLPEVVVHHHPPPRRDHGPRRRVQARNAIWCAWLRRPARPAARLTARALVRGLRDPAERGGLADALRGAAWVAARRRVVPPELERSLRALERAG